MNDGRPEVEVVGGRSEVGAPCAGDARRDGASRQAHVMRTVRTGVAFALVIGLSVTFIPHAVAQSQAVVASGGSTAVAGGVVPDQTAEYEKSEVVYASLSASGEPQAVYVVNRFDVADAGTVVDYGDYASVRNLTDETSLERVGVEGDSGDAAPGGATEGADEGAAKGADAGTAAGGSAMGAADSATVFSADEGVFYYQGNASAAELALPWDIAVTYELDGKEVSAEDLAGASGNLAVRISTTRNEDVRFEFFESFMLQITLTLDGSAASDIMADGATVASSGKDWTVAFTALPGREGDFELSAQVRDFAMDGMQIAALPYSSVVDMPDIDSMVGEMDDLVDATNQLASGAADLSEGARSLASGARDFSEGMTSFGEAFSEIGDSSKGMVQGSAQIAASLKGIAAKLEGVDLSGLGGLAKLPANLRAVADGLDELAATAVPVGEGLSRSVSAIDAAMAQLLANAPTESEIAALREQVKGDASSAATVEKLVAVHRSAQAAKGTWDGAKAGIEGAESFLTALSASAEAGGALAAQSQALRAMSDSLESSLGEGSLDGLDDLATGMTQLADEYEQFHEGLAAYAGGVSALAENYGEIAGGASDLADGAGSLSDGAAAFSDGMATFDESMADLPRIMRERIDELTADYDFPEFDPVSFVSSANANTTAVQFVMTTPAIEAPEPAVEEEPQQEELTIWDRFVALFQG